MKIISLMIPARKCSHKDEVKCMDHFDIKNGRYDQINS